MGYKEFLRVIRRIRGYLIRKKAEEYFLASFLILSSLFLLLDLLSRFSPYPGLPPLPFYLLGGIAFILSLLFARFRYPSLLRVAFILDEHFKTGNIFVNTLDLAEREDTPFRSLFLRRSFEILGTLKLSRLLSPRRRYLLRLLPLMILLVAIYYSLFPRTSPAVPLPPPRYSLEVYPGDAQVMRGDSLRIIAIPREEIPSYAKIVRGGEIRLMEFKEGRFYYSWDRVRESFSYRVIAPGFKSPLYSVKVRDRLRIISSRFEVFPPSYTGEAKVVLENPSFPLSLLEGSRLKFSLLFNYPLQKAQGEEVQDISIKGKELKGVVRGAREGFGLQVVDRRGLERKFLFPLSLKKDLPPQVRVISPGDREVEPGEEVEIVLGLEDDYGLREGVVYYRRGEKVEVMSRLRIEGGRKELWRLRWRIPQEAGKEIVYWGEAKDNQPPEGKWGKSPLYTLQIREKEEGEERVSLQEILEREKSLYKKTVLALQENKGESLDEEQEGIRRDTLKLSREMEPSIFPIAEELENLAREEMREAVYYLSFSRWEKALEMERRIIEKLKVFLNQEKLREEGKEKEVVERLEEVSKRLEDFLEGGEELIRTDSSSEEFPAILSRLMEEIRDLRKEVNKLPSITIPYSTLREEVNKIWSDVEKAEELYSSRVKVMKVSREEIGLDLAEKIMEDLEMWLPDTPDRLRWELEEPLEPVDVPMAELPETLEDLIGELLESEEELLWDAEDLTSSWADSLSAAGWAVMDGPISNFSARGKTGNVLPNINEITGRSGEGRTGPTSGELVQETVQGLGGRKTPLRYTPDQPMEGVIKEEGSVPAGGGTTLGGKVAGGGEGGLPGAAVPDYLEDLKRLERASINIMNMAQKVNWSLYRMGYPVKKMERVIQNLRESEEAFRKKDLRTFLRKHRDVLFNLAEIKEGIREWKGGKGEKVSPLYPFPLTRQEIEEFPPEYRQLIEEYFLRLTEK